MTEFTKINGCWKCGTEYFLPTELYLAAKRSPNISFFCPYGHSAVFPAGETEADKLRRERDRLTQRLAEKDDEIVRRTQQANAAERRASAARGQVTKIRNRVGHGVCPCCNRSFGNLQRHMASEHPSFARAEDLNGAEARKDLG